MGGTLAPTEAPGGIAGTGVTVLAQADPGPAPEAPKAFKKKGEESGGIIAMIDLLIKDLDKEMTEAEFTEKDAQEDYKTFMSDSASKRAEDSKMLTDKEGTKADLQASLQENGAAKESAVKELMATEEYISSLHADCDWLLCVFALILCVAEGKWLLGKDREAAVAKAKASTCPGSGSWIHASCQLTAMLKATCADARDEIKARVAGTGGWYDPHNRGTYHLLGETTTVVQVSRDAASGGYVDKINFTFQDVGSNCLVTACSESQGTSVYDYSTNYCNIHDLYCGTADKCKVAVHDFASTESLKSCSYHDATMCLKL